jgi:hypothetical protein
MAKFVVESSHTAEECVKALEESLEIGNLENFVFGCKSGEHTGWAYVDAKNEEEALKMVPEFIRDDACAYEVGKFTPEELKAAH